ncbi:MAG TPA: MBL fold metallo-hydrolase [Solirubrobacteraceae bacterium]|jgi:glyoxylase-like metal-dependent hydrolase (beta-lactamase superfamily II)|nr:MBL fold metallo-hydrolase [Solirubrobacteraceae bacterium]
MTESHVDGQESGAGSNGDSAEAGSEADLLNHYDILRVRAPNPGPLTLSGTNTWVVGRHPAWVVDPGPLDEKHVARLSAAIEARGGLGGVALTHDHHDHTEAVGALLERFPAPLAGGRGAVDVLLGERVRFGPFESVPTPGHSVDHHALVADGACFTGDAVLGEGSVFISPYRGAMSGYLLALTRLRLREDFNVLCPGHGAPVWDAHKRLEEYLAHRVDRENRLIVALGEGRRTVEELLDAVWFDVPEQLLPLATATLAAHLDKLDDEQILPDGVERPRFERREW